MQVAVWGLMMQVEHFLIRLQQSDLKLQTQGLMGMIESSLSMLQVQIRHTMMANFSRQLCRRFPALSSDTGQNGQGILLNLCTGINCGSIGR